MYVLWDFSYFSGICWQIYCIASMPVDASLLFEKKAPVNIPADMYCCELDHLT